MVYTVTIKACAEVRSELLYRKLRRRVSCKGETEI